MFFPRHLLDSLLHSLFSKIPLLSEASLGYPVEDDTPLGFYPHLAYANFLLAFVTTMTINSTCLYLVFLPLEGKLHEDRDFTFFVHFCISSA